MYPIAIAGNEPAPKDTLTKNSEEWKQDGPADAGHIIHAEAAGHYCILESIDGRFLVDTGIRELARKLEGHGDFMFCHRSHLINVRRISEIGRQELIMDNGISVPVSRRLYKGIYERFVATFAGTV